MHPVANQIAEFLLTRDSLVRFHRPSKITKFVSIVNLYYYNKVNMN